MNDLSAPFHSFLAPWIRQYLEFRKRLGYSVVRKSYDRFRELDYYVSWRMLSRFEEIDESFANDWMFSVPSQANSTKNCRLNLLRGFCCYLVRQNVMKDNPTRAIPYLPVKPPHPHLYTLHELTTILQEAERWKNRPTYSFVGWVMGTLIHLLYACGLRIGEALRLKIRDVDFEENTLSLWNTKFHKERLVPFSQRTRARLQKYLVVRTRKFPRSAGPEGYVFCHRRGPYDPSCIERLFRKLLGRCGLKRPRGPRLHDFRHSFAVHRLYKWYQDGHDILNKLPILSTYMGHVSVENTQVYLTVTRWLLREADRRFQAGFEEVSRRALRRLTKKHP